VKEMKKIILSVVVVVSLFMVAATSANANGSVGWNSGTFRWGLGFRAYNDVVFWTEFTSPVRLITSGEMRVRSTGALVAGSPFRFDTVSTFHRPERHIPTNRTWFGTHEARGTTSIARYTSVSRP
jgi:hypothetical protein